MPHTFRTEARLWPSGTEIDLGTDSNEFSGENWFTRNAANFVTTDGVHQYQFLFWNTGRRLTARRLVRWHFFVLDWTTWTATRWYGVPPTEPGIGPPRVRTDGLSLTDNMPFSDTPINAPASTFTPASAHPFNGDDHSIGTAGGNVTVVPKDPFHSLDFKGWLALRWGGIPEGEFLETDEGPTSGSNGFGIFEPISGTNFNAPQNSSHDLVASYANNVEKKKPIDLGKLLDEYLTNQFVHPGDLVSDNSPLDRLRFALLEAVLRQTQPASAKAASGGGGVDFQRLIERAGNMSKDELKRALKDIQTTLDLGKTASSAIEAQLKKK